MKRLVPIVSVIGLTASLAGPPVNAQRPAGPTAEALIDQAVAKASAEQKLIFVDFGASWCAPCRRLWAFLHAPEVKPIIDKHFVLVTITVWESGDKAVLNTSGGEALMAKWQKVVGIPVYTVIDSSRTPVANGFDYPGRQRDIESFIGLLGKAAPRMTDAERATIAAYLSDHSNSSGSISGRVLNADRAPEAKADITLLRRIFTEGQWELVFDRRTVADENGRFTMEAVHPGDYQLIAESAAARDSHRKMTAAHAGLVTIERGTDLTAATLTLTSSSVAAIGGRVLKTDGSPAQGITVTAVGADRPTSKFSSTTATDGSFSIPGASSGRYVLWARIPPSTDRVGAPREIGMTEVSVTDRDVTGLSIRTAAGSSVTGRIIFQGPVLTAADRSAIRIEAVAVEAAAGAPRERLQSPISADNRFEVRGVWGKRVFRVENLPAGWILRSVVAAGKDLTDSAVDFRTTDDLHNTVITIERSGGTLAGIAVDADGKARRGGLVIAFAADSARWTYPSRFLKYAPVDEKGSYVVRSLPPGTYLVAWVPSLESNWASPESLTKSKGVAQEIIVR